MIAKVQTGFFSRVTSKAWALAFLAVEKFRSD